MQEHLASRVVEAGTKLRVRSALNPVLWLCAIITGPALIACAVIGSPPNWLVFLTCTPVCIASFGFLFLLFFDRDKLQSEDYQLRKQSLEVIQQKGDEAPQLIDESVIQVIANPEIKALTSGEEETK